ncbi:MAG: nucleotidyltransferase domain-containing protein [Candidatus Aminicenantes bacterium]|nr:nucleotidyltransferase domain-containing protein [Candidatus Aminicenantes bacterium]
MRPVDILPKDLEAVLDILRRFVAEFEVRAVGSRASGNARRYSDLDLVVMTERPLEVSVLAGLNSAFSDSDLPFSVDVLDWASLDETFRRLIAEGSVVIQPKG